MSTMPCPAAMPNAAIVGWLLRLLRERLCDDLALAVAADGDWRITLVGSDGALRLGPIVRGFYTPGVDLPCTGWPVEPGWPCTLGPRLPAPGANSLPDPLIKQCSDGLRLGYDALGLAYWALNRVEEINSDKQDQYGRFATEASHAVRHGYLDRPIVDEWLDIIGQAMCRVWPRVVLKERAFEVAVSHDVDEPGRYAFRGAIGLARAMLSDLTVHTRPLSALRAPWVRCASLAGLHRWDPYNNFDWIMAASERRGIRSSFYFLCGRTDPLRDADYDPDHPAIRALLRRIHARGHEIGLHPSYNTFERSELLVREAHTLRRVALQEGIEQPLWGGRMHYLRWRSPVTLRAWEEAGMSYDSTLGYGDCPGFRCGTCVEYPAFDPVAMRPLALRLRPLVAMESSVIADRYLGLGLGNAALQRFLGVKNACRAVRGQFTLLWHNSELASARARGLYESVLDA